MVQEGMNQLYGVQGGMNQLCLGHVLRPLGPCWPTERGEDQREQDCALLVPQISARKVAARKARRAKAAAQDARQEAAWAVAAEAAKAIVEASASEAATQVTAVAVPARAKKLLRSFPITEASGPGQSYPPHTDPSRSSFNGIPAATSFPRQLAPLGLSPGQAVLIPRSTAIPLGRRCLLGSSSGGWGGKAGATASTSATAASILLADGTEVEEGIVPDTGRGSCGGRGCTLFAAAEAAPAPGRCATSRASRDSRGQLGAEGQRGKRACPFTVGAAGGVGEGQQGSGHSQGRRQKIACSPGPHGSTSLEQPGQLHCGLLIDIPPLDGFHPSFLNLGVELVAGLPLRGMTEVVARAADGVDVRCSTTTKDAERCLCSASSSAATQGCSVVKNSSDGEDLLQAGCQDSPLPALVANGNEFLELYDMDPCLIETLNQRVADSWTCASTLRSNSTIPRRIESSPHLPFCARSTAWPIGSSHIGFLQADGTPGEPCKLQVHRAWDPTHLVQWHALPPDYWMNFHGNHGAV